MKILLKNICLSLVTLLLLVSCEDWLSVTANTQIRAKDQFKTEQGFKDALIGSYISMALGGAAEDPLKKAPLYAKDMTWGFVDILNQQYNALSVFADYYYVQDYQYERQSVMDKIDNIWTSMYQTIANVNLELEYINKNQDMLGPIDYKIIKGELLGLRAFLHFDLMRLFGYGNLADQNISTELAIPYVTKYTKLPTPRRSYTETFDLLLNDIQKALELLKTDPVYQNAERPADFYDEVNRKGFYNDRELRMNYYAVKALQARVYLWIGGEQNLEKALIAAEDVINNSPAKLIDAGSYSVSQDPILYPEMIFGLKVDEFANIVNPFLKASQNTDYNALFLPANTVNKVYETNKPLVGLSDVRYTRMLDKQTLGFVCIKLYQPYQGLSGIVHPDVMPLIKLPEMYYIAAEVYAKTNQLSKAIDYLNAVRTSRGIVQEIPAAANKEKVLEEIGKEYQKEFVMEGQLFFYYKRLGKTEIPGYSSEGEVGEDIYKLPYPDSQVIAQ